MTSQNQTFMLNISKSRHHIVIKFISHKPVQQVRLVKMIKVQCHFRWYLPFDNNILLSFLVENQL